MTLSIDPDFRKLIPPLSADEFAQLEANLLAEGCRDALVAWKHGDALTLVDGHNRFDICTKHSIEYKVIEREFESRSDALVWMITNQLARRNLTVAARVQLAERMRETTEEQAKERMLAGKKTDPTQNSAGGETRKKLAEIAETSHDTYKKVVDVLKNAPDTIKSKTLSGELSVNRAGKLTKALEDATPEVIEIVTKGNVDDPDTVEELKRLQIEAPNTLEDVRLSGYFQSSLSSCHVSDGYKKIKAVLKDLSRDHAVVATQERKQNSLDKALSPDAKYRVIYADPPWKYDNTMPDYFTEQADHYDLMTIDEIRDMPVKAMTEDDAVLFLWVTSPVLEQSFEIVKAWGFKYKASFVWDKVKHNMGHYNSVRHEFLMVCVRGSCQPDVKQLFDSVVSEERSDRHSEKPEAFRKIIDTIYPYGKRIELFARVRVDKWDAYGNELPDTEKAA